MKKGKLIILSGPSGVGKGTVRQYLMKDNDLDLKFSISMTTREPRDGEENGREYFFVSKEEFEEALKNDELLEHATFVNHSYGTPKKYVDNLLGEGHNVLLEIETFGAAQVMEKYRTYGYISIFLTCGSLEELEKRIRGRGSESEEAVKGRLTKAMSELKLQKNYKFVVLNDVAERAANEIAEIIKNN